MNVSSGSSRLTPGPPFDAGFTGSTIGIYGASKAALNRMTNALAVELHGTGVRVNTVEPRAAVLSEGADALVGTQLKPEQIETMDDMVDGALVVCDCPPELTGQICVSLDLLGK